MAQGLQEFVEGMCPEVNDDIVLALDYLEQSQNTQCKGDHLYQILASLCTFHQYYNKTGELLYGLRLALSIFAAEGKSLLLTSCPCPWRTT